MTDDTAVSAEQAMEAHLVACIDESLAAFLYDNACFLCERLMAHDPSPANKRLLATCYIRADKPHRAYELLQGPGLQDDASRYLLAQACMRLGKVPEAESALNPDNMGYRIPNGAAGYFLLGRICKMTKRVEKAIEHFSTALRMDVLMWSAFEELCSLGADGVASEYLSLSLPGQQMKATPQRSDSGTPFALLSAAATQMPNTCSASPARRPLGHESTPATSSFTLSHLPASAQAYSTQSTQGATPDHFITPSPTGLGAGLPPPLQRAQRGGQTQARGRHNPAASPQANGVRFAAGEQQRSASPQLMPCTPQTGSQQQHASANGRPQHAVSGPPATAGTPWMPSHPAGSPQAPPGPPQRTANAPAASPQPPTMQFSAGGAAASTPAQRTRQRGAQNGRPADESQNKTPPGKASGQNGRSNRLFASDSSTGLRRSSRVAPAPDALGLRAMIDASADPASLADSGAEGSMGGGTKTQEGQAACLSLLQAAGDGYRLLCMYHCHEAIHAFGRLPPMQYSTGWVLSCIGRAYFEMVDYKSAAEAFEWARKADPSRLEGMEVYSTVLWHLKKESALSHLAREAVAWDRRSPHAWAIMGNCFSLQKEHEAALRYFQRANQLDPGFAYAYTLSGHEYFACEDFEQARKLYETALSMDARHYNAWYGLGQIDFRQEKYEVAATHFQRAISINGRSSVLRCSLGTTLAKMGQPGAAVGALREAIRADPANPLARFELAGVHLTQEHFHDALAELTLLRDVAPKEASVWFQMGKIFKRLDLLNEALLHFNHALDLKPSSADAALIKQAVEKLHVSDDIAEEEI